MGSDFRLTAGWLTEADELEGAGDKMKLVSCHHIKKRRRKGRRRPALGVPDRADNHGRPVAGGRRDRHPLGRRRRKWWLQRPGPGLASDEAGSALGEVDCRTEDLLNHNCTKRHSATPSNCPRGSPIETNGSSNWPEQLEDRRRRPGFHNNSINIDINNSNNKHRSRLPSERQSRPAAPLLVASANKRAAESERPRANKWQASGKLLPLSLMCLLLIGCCQDLLDEGLQVAEVIATRGGNANHQLSGRQRAMEVGPEVGWAPMGAPTKRATRRQRANRWLGPIGFAAADTDANRLYEELMNSYNRIVRPIQNESQPVVVRLGLKLTQLMDVVSLAVLFVVCCSIAALASHPLQWPTDRSFSWKQQLWLCRCRGRALIWAPDKWLGAAGSRISSPAGCGGRPELAKLRAQAKAEVSLQVVGRLCEANRAQSI